MTNEYNGWTNYETWNVKLWMDNDQSSQEYWSEAARETYERAEAGNTFTKDENAALALMAQIKDEHEDFVQDALEKSNLQASWVADLMGAAMSERRHEKRVGASEETNRPWGLFNQVRPSRQSNIGAGC